MSIPSEIQWLDLSQIYGADPFSILGFRASGVRASTHLKLSFAEIMKLWSIHLLDPMVKFLSYDLWCRSFPDFRVSVFSNREFMMQRLEISYRFNPRILIWKFMYEINDCEPPLIRRSRSLLRLHLSSLFSPNFLASWLDPTAHGILTLLPGSAPPSDSTLVNLFRDSGLGVTKNLAYDPSS
jgi:hypothetical protein